MMSRDLVSLFLSARLMPPICLFCIKSLLCLSTGFSDCASVDEYCLCMIVLSLVRSFIRSFVCVFVSRGELLLSCKKEKESHSVQGSAYSHR